MAFSNSKTVYCWCASKIFYRGNFAYDWMCKGECSKGIGHFFFEMQCYFSSWYSLPTLYILQLEKQELMKADTLVYSLWSLLPSFCNYPSDTAKSFKDLEKHLRSNLKEEPNIRGIICTSLQLLIRQNKNIKDSNDKDDSRQDMAKEQVLYNYSQQVATENLRALEISAKNLLKDLSDVFLKSTKDDGGCMQVLFLQCSMHHSWAKYMNCVFCMCMHVSIT